METVPTRTGLAVWRGVRADVVGDGVELGVDRCW
jgi:hypothetical protein